MLLLLLHMGSSVALSACPKTSFVDVSSYTCACQFRCDARGVCGQFIVHLGYQVCLIGVVALYMPSLPTTGLTAIKIIDTPFITHMHINTHSFWDRSGLPSFRWDPELNLCTCGLIPLSCAVYAESSCACELLCLICLLQLVLSQLGCCMDPDSPREQRTHRIELHFPQQRQHTLVSRGSLKDSEAQGP